MLTIVQIADAIPSFRYFAKVVKGKMGILLEK